MGARWQRLSAREREVLERLAQGLTNRQISEALGISERTVEKHVSRVLTKLEARSRTEAALWAAKHGRK